MPWADLNDTVCFYEIDGIGEPIIFIPGLGGIHQDWDSAVKAFQQDYTVIRPDFRGIGKSTLKRQPQSLSHYSADILELVEFLGLDEVNIVGMSLGGIVAQRFAIDFPNNVKKLVLISCAHKFGTYLRQMAILVGMAKWKFSKKAFAHIWEMLASSPKFLDAHPERLDERYRSILEDKTPKKNIIQQLKCLSNSDPKDGEHSRIVADTLIISSEFDTIIPYCYGKDMSEVISNSKFILLKGVGHNPIIECPDIVYKHVHDFLGK